MASEELTEFGKRLETVMKKKKLSGSKLAKKLKIAQPQLFILLRTETPRAKTLQKLSKALGKPIKFWNVESTKDSVKMKSSNEHLPPAILHSINTSAKIRVYIVVEANGKEIARQPLKT